MFFGIFGFIISSLLVAIGLGYKLTRDIYPHALKKFLTRLALTNWQRAQPKKYGFYESRNPKTLADTGIIVCPVEAKLEEPATLREQHDEDKLEFYGVDEKGNGFVAKMTRAYGNVTEAVLYVVLDGIQYSVSRRGRTSSPYEFSLGNFKLEMVEPMRCWRIWYNGPLKCERSVGSDEDMVHAVINFLWKPFTSPADSKKEANLNLLSDYFTKKSRFGEKFPDLPDLLPDGYSQFGVTHGTIRIDEAEIPPLYLYGFRTRTFTREAEEPGKTRYELFGMSGSTDGTVFRLSALHDGFTDGHIYYSSDDQFPILSVDFEAEVLERNHRLPKLFTLNGAQLLNTESIGIGEIHIYKRSSLRIELWPCLITQSLSSLEIVLVRLSINGREGNGLVLRRKSGNLLTSKVAPGIDWNMNPISAYDPTLDLRRSAAGLRAPDILPFDSDLALNVPVVGGKGASLARIARIRDLNQALQYKTARGFCVTTALFSSCLDLKKVKQVFAEAKESDLDHACYTVMSHIKSSSAGAEISESISSWIDKIFGPEARPSLRLAVRSSGVLEDADDLSCAGQNETFLGVLPADVPARVVDCWASLFTPQSVKYRLNHGLPAESEMAVVVQEMVSPQAAGVIFTADPRTGNPFQIIINANYGLGESVVSAACDPDTITLVRSPSTKPSTELTIGKKVMGDKKSKIVLSPEGSTREVEMTQHESQAYCLTDELALELGAIALQIETETGDFKPVDIEWALAHDGSIYILQSRGITSLDSWTDFELIHELDTPLRTKFERITKANTGEVMPGATSPLGLSVVSRLLDFAIQRRMRDRTREPSPIVPYSFKTTHLWRHRVLLNVFNTFYRNNDKEINTAQIAMDFSVFGHRVIDEEVHALSLERHGIFPALSKIRELTAVVGGVWESKKVVKGATERFSNFTIPLENAPRNSTKLYSIVTEGIFAIYDICLVHCAMSEASGVTQMFAFLALAQGRKAEEWDSDLYEDISKVLSVCVDVESADLPGAMDELANTVVQNGGDPRTLTTAFTEKTPAEGFEWLRHHSNLIVQQALDKFLEKHGHRCIAELDLMRKSWKSDPIPFVTLLQSLVRNKVKFGDSWSSGAKSNFSDVQTLLSNLKTPVSWGGKQFLKFVLPYCRDAVWNREKTKSLLVRTADQVKQAYELLASTMVQEHLIPNDRLIYFMTHQEIGAIIEGHPTSSRILYKAMRRLKLHPQINREQFDEITIGIPEPIDPNVTLELGDSLQATPVSSGRVQATAKVCRTIEEASSVIEPGDILITNGTDIGWSPFFPILGGIVTELGGLISHGAVVAREYGLPCIVGAVNATKVFKTGDQVILDAGKGTLTKVKT